MNKAPLLLLFFLSLPVSAETGTQQSYIDRLKATMPAEPASEGSFIESRKKNLPPEEKYENYSEHLRKTDPQLSSTSEASKDYSAKEKAKLKPVQDTSPIQNVKDGKSELQLKREGKISQAIGFKLAASSTHSIAVGSTQRKFKNLYGESWKPEMDLFYEVQILRRENIGSVGLLFTGGFLQATAQGKFDFSPNRPGGGTYGDTSNTSFRWVSIPVSLGPNARLTLLRWLHFYGSFSPVAIHYWENRSDDKSEKKGRSWSLRSTVGAAIPLDFLSRSSSWDLYDSAGVKHYYLTVDYTDLSAWKGDLTFAGTTYWAGFAFEI